MNHYKLPAGVQDLLPEEYYNLSLLLEKLKKKFRLAGCRFVQSSALEYYDTFAEIRNRIPQNKMFKMTDGDGSILVLRPDMTLAVSRIAATKLKTPCVKLAYVDEVWNNFETSGNISQRGFLQAGVEFLGVEGAFSDAQTLAFAVECLKEAGLTDFTLDVGHVGFFKGLLSGAGLGETDTERIRASINAKDSVSTMMILKETGVAGRAAEAIQALPSLFGGEEVFARAEKLTENPVALAAISHLKKVNALLKEFGCEKYVSFDLGSVKSLSYYSGVVFTGLTGALGAPILSGGRYDYLADDFGKHIPAVGFAMGLKRILMALERHGKVEKLPAPYAVILAKEGFEAEAYKEYLRLTAAGKTVDLYAGSYGEGLEYAREKHPAKILAADQEGVKEV
ncbi:MAG: ATP phosphoribosyltransferase regulatory subunit [Clostridia bacterium]|nr:ATP phosphoribosyltransferase regulatory subunit [Clostridia bacterium]